MGPLRRTGKTAALLMRLSQGEGRLSRVEALRGLGAREVRTLALFAGGRGTTDYAGPEVTVPVLQPWIRDALLTPVAAVRVDGSEPLGHGGSTTEAGAHQRTRPVTGPRSEIERPI